MVGQEQCNVGTDDGRIMLQNPSAQPILQPVLLKSKLLLNLGIPHCFTTRRGGYSAGAFATLNFGNPSELLQGDPRRDTPATIGLNLGLVMDAMGVRGREVVQVHQVHGAEVHMVRAGAASHCTTDGTTTKADSIVTDDAARLVGVRVADCAPVLIAGFDDGGACVGVAAVHAGWRGAVTGIAERTVDSLHAIGASEIIAAIGPCIGPDAFEVGPEVATAFRERFGIQTKIVRERDGGKFDVDLAGSIGEQLLARGVRADRIDVIAHCTVAQSDYYFSHRRERGMTGRMIALIGMPSK